MWEWSLRQVLSDAKPIGIEKLIACPALEISKPGEWHACGTIGLGADSQRSYRRVSYFYLGYEEIMIRRKEERRCEGHVELYSVPVSEPLRRSFDPAAWMPPG